MCSFATSRRTRSSLHGSPAATEEERAWALGVVRAPVTDPDRFDRVWQQVAALSGALHNDPRCGERGRFIDK